MRRLIQSSIFLCLALLQAQGGINISGNMHLHSESKLGVHGDFLYSGDLQTEENSLVGFYGSVPNIVDGDRAFTLYDVEFANEVVVFLRTEIEVENNANFISGDLLTPLNFEEAFINFKANSFYTGTSNETKVTGFVGATNKEEFSFPVGYQGEIRPLLLRSQEPNTLAKCAYLKEDPDAPGSLVNTSFDTSRLAFNLGAVSNTEFWLLQGDVPSTVTITWNATSNLLAITEDIEELVIVGFRKSDSNWVALSGSTASGNLAEGIITSTPFVPNEYAAITFGKGPDSSDSFVARNPRLGNYFLSPNGDGINDTFVIPEIEGTGDNQLSIFNRYGQMVFTQDNYWNEFYGLSNADAYSVQQEIGLPEGFYYYVINLIDLGLKYQGFLFLDRQ